MCKSSLPIPLYWTRVKRLTFVLLGAWVLLILGVVLLSPYININWFGMPLTYGLISSVLLLSFLMLVACFARGMDKLDKQSRLK
jgi:putative solute:sodium symporter small subunit